jgi:hypothetical protein
MQNFAAYLEQMHVKQILNSHLQIILNKRT